MQLPTGWTRDRVSSRSSRLALPRVRSRALSWPTIGSGTGDAINIVTPEPAKYCELDHTSTVPVHTFDLGW